MLGSTAITRTMTAVNRSQALTGRWMKIPRSPREIARALMPSYGFDLSQFSCLDSLYMFGTGLHDSETSARPVR